MKKKWEHKLVYTESIGVEAVLKMGEDGWQICGVTGSAVILKEGEGL